MYTVCFLHIHFLTIYFMILILGDVERAQWLRSRVAFAEDPGLGLSMHRVAHNHLHLQLQGSMSSSCLFEHWTHELHSHACR